MCRYHGTTYKDRWACFSCRKAFKDFDKSGSRESAKCPQCGDEMSYMAKDFKPPRKEAKTQWEKVKILTEKRPGVWSSCGCEGPGYIPKTLSEVKRRVGIKKRVDKKWSKAIQKRYK